MSNSIGSQRNERRGKEMFKLATFNVRGLTKRVKQEQLSRDMKKYKIDIACLQETKITDSLNININNYRLVCTETNTQHYGNGFMIAARWQPYIHRFWRINDRISVLQLQTKQSKKKKSGESYGSSRITEDGKLIISKEEPVDHMINIINIYAPTSEKVERNEEEIKKLYTEIEKLMKTFKKQKSSVTFIAGDFNAKVGKRSNEEEKNIIGGYSTGERNRSGEILMDFCRRNELYICNTAFQHPVRHRTTWTQQRTEKRTNTTKTIHNQIDYILVKTTKRHNIRNARTYAGTETYSDHKLLISEFETNWVKMYRMINKKRAPTTKRFDTRKLITEKKVKEEYQKKLAERTRTTNTWEELSDVCKTTAEEVIGYTKNSDKQKHVDDEEIIALSCKQKQVRMNMMNEKHPDKVRKMRIERKEIQRTIQKRLKSIREEEIDRIAEEIEKTKDDVRMFKAMKKVEKKTFENPVVHDKENKCVTDPEEMYEIITEYFRRQFFNEGVDEVERFKGRARRLNRPITKHEVIKAIQHMANNKAAGKDSISVEMLKYAPDIVFEKIACHLNNIFELHEDIDTGAAVLVPLQKPPPKKKGPVKNLRPINLLLVIRKMLSKIALRRSGKAIDRHLSHSQSAYRSFRSTTDIVWSYKWIIAKVQEYDITIYVTGIDMSAAFDTVDRNRLLEIAEGVLDEDGLRMLRVLLSDTTIEVRVKGAESKPFKSNVGSPQGDSYSGPQFTMYFEVALREVREETNITGEEDLPEEMIYADDYDHLTEDREKKSRFKEKVKDILGRYDLRVNEDKTEDTILKRGKHDRKKKIKNEPWRDTIKLGSKLGDKEDIIRRKNISTGKMVQMRKILNRKKIVKTAKKMKLYNALVKSVLLYNSSTWGLTKDDENKLDSFHRKQLRQVLGVYYPHKISNKKLYEVTNTRPISIDITKARWKMFGHALRMDQKTPARKAMNYYFRAPEGIPKFRGRKRATIVTTLNRDIKRTKEKYTDFRLPELKSELNLRNTRVKALNRKHWQTMVKMVTNAAHSEGA